MLEQSTTWLTDQRVTHLATPVTYQRGIDSVVVPATIGQTVFRFDSQDGATIRTVSRDFLIRAADLILNGLATEPQRGDRITETDGGKTFTYEVMSPGGNEPAWRYSDPYRRTLRIHTKGI